VEHVIQWQKVFDDDYSQLFKQEDGTSNFTGWISSYNDRQIPEEEMLAWIESTVDRIMSYQPRRVFEIGCGNGLLLFRIAPNCIRYHGTDFSSVALEYVRERMGTDGKRLQQVTLDQRLADDFEGIKGKHYDAIILNSVAQYFPNINYLLRVIEGAISVLESGGFIFIGDVRNYPLLEAFHASVQLHRSESSLTKAQLWQRVQRHVAQEEELVIDPAFFIALKQYLPNISCVEIMHKRGQHHNELTKFRFDVVLHVGNDGKPTIQPSWIDWKEDLQTLTSIKNRLLDTQPPILGVKTCLIHVLQWSLKPLNGSEAMMGLRGLGIFRK
jgi:SAM-dependent methyltransferase